MQYLFLFQRTRLTLLCLLENSEKFENLCLEDNNKTLKLMVNFKVNNVKNEIENKQVRASGV